MSTKSDCGSSKFYSTCKIINSGFIKGIFWFIDEDGKFYHASSSGLNEEDINFASSDFEIPKHSTIYKIEKSALLTLVIIVTPEGEFKIIFTYDGINWNYKNQ